MIYTTLTVAELYDMLNTKKIELTDGEDTILASQICFGTPVTENTIIRRGFGLDKEITYIPINAGKLMALFRFLNNTLPVSGLVYFKDWPKEDKGRILKSSVPIVFWDLSPDEYAYYTLIYQ